MYMMLILSALMCYSGGIGHWVAAPGVHRGPLPTCKYHSQSSASIIIRYRYHQHIHKHNRTMIKTNIKINKNARNEPHK
jgi:hypothetical protein